MTCRSSVIRSVSNSPAQRYTNSPRTTATPAMEPRTHKVTFRDLDMATRTGSYYASPVYPETVQPVALTPSE